ncbi:hypothetical protein GH714_009853 [Hevea brasiliensis]|uniref:B-like cyclin n=1 Tax=Hevea brasiliensis TaxID=3981 RepID=A0A6A6L3Z1_HEVBR|nr:hypothetical protein GH714_009853 [Hevea brasiliensis]
MSLDDSSSAVNSLYCDEDANEVVQFDADSWISDCLQSPSFSGYSPPYDENIVNRLIDSEPHFMPLSDYLHRCRDCSIDTTARQDSINWILKVHAYYQFRPITVLLSVNYFDRFLSSLLPANGWPFQLLSVACLSLAAKMEEVHVPPLLDLEILEPDSFLNPKPSKEWSLIDFLGFTPSTIAAAAVLCAVGESFETPTTDVQLFHERISKEMVRSCHQLMLEYLIDTCPSARPKHPSVVPPTAPPSPVGVLDAAACGSCDTRSELPNSISQAEAEPLAKRSDPLRQMYSDSR